MGRARLPRGNCLTCDAVLDRREKQYCNVGCQQARKYLHEKHLGCVACGWAVRHPAFLNDLGANNNREWFVADRQDYEQYFLEPAREFDLDLWFWQGCGPSRERPGDFFSLMPERPVLGVEALKRLTSGVPADDRLAGCFAQYERLAPLQQWLVDVLLE